MKLVAFQKLPTYILKTILLSCLLQFESSRYIIPLDLLGIKLKIGLIRNIYFNQEKNNFLLNC